MTSTLGNPGITYPLLGETTNIRWVVESGP